MQVCVVGLGYIGLPMALLLANANLPVCGFDVDDKKISKLKNKQLYFSEKNLDKIFTKALTKNIKFTSELETNDVFIVAVPTPQNDGEADLKYVFSALDLIKNKFVDGNLIILESTIGPRDCIDKIIPHIKSWGKKFHFAHCPERAIPGNTLYEMQHNVRIVGAEDKKSQVFTQKIYQTFVKNKIYVTDTTTAAACKVMENTFRAVNIALANEFAQLAEKLDFNIWEAINLANQHPRVNILQPGPGVGGHCIPIDPWFFVKQKRHGLIHHALLINQQQPKLIAQKINKFIKSNNLTQPKIGILGLAYKKNVDDDRESPSYELIRILEKKYTVLMHDPHVKNEKIIALNKLLDSVNILVLITDHDEYQKINLAKYQNIKYFLDTRNQRS